MKKYATLILFLSTFGCLNVVNSSTDLLSRKTFYYTYENLIGVNDFTSKLGIEKSFINFTKNPVGMVCIKSHPSGHIGTGTLIDSNLFLTNKHVVEALGIDLNTTLTNKGVFFGLDEWKEEYESYSYDFSQDGIRWVKIKRVLEWGYSSTESEVGFYYPDYAILELEEDVGYEFGWANLSSETPNPDNVLIMIQHPGYHPNNPNSNKQVDVGFCNGIVKSNDDLYVEFSLDAVVGSSGSGVLNTKGELTGLFYAGGIDTKRAVTIESLLRYSPILRDFASYKV